MDELTIEEIDLILSTTKQRGVIKPVIENFIESGEIYINLSEQFPGKDALSLRNSVKQNIDKHFAKQNLRLVTPGDKDNKVLLLINMDKYNAAKSTENDENENEQGTDTE